jgi:diacylglycerol kinase (ATP)
MIKKSRNFWESLGFATDGILYSIRTQRNIRIHSVFALGIVFAAILFHVSRQELLILVLTIVLVITLEIINTAVEAVVDLYTEEYLPLARIAKNVAAGAVLLASLGAIVIGGIIFGPRVWQLLF